MTWRIGIIGAGHVGTTLGLLFARAGHQIADVACRTKTSAEKACAIIGGGRACGEDEDISAADIYIVATGDNVLSSIATQLLRRREEENGSWKGCTIFHCSGATPSAILAPLRDAGAAIAGVHPVKTFTSPAQDAETFPGTWCGMEGDDAALRILEPIFQGIGGQTFAIDGERKTLYHAAIVFICNYLFPLLEIGEQCYEAAGVPRETAAQIVRPILHATVDNALRLGPAAALTGPIARGDDSIVAKQLAALTDLNPQFARLYRELGLVAADLSAQKGAASAEGLAAIRELLAS